MNSTKKTALVCGAGGFIGHHMVNNLKKEGFWVKGVDLKNPEFSKTQADEFIIGDLRDFSLCQKIFNLPFDEVYQFAADMGGAGFVFTGENDADVLFNSATINLNVVKNSIQSKVKKIFFPSSACVYPAYNQIDPNNPRCAEDSVFPAQPDSDYGWEKIFSEKLYLAFHRNYNLNIRIARFHNIYGPEGTWFGGREKSPAAICRKIIEAKRNGSIDIWGDGLQTRSFLYIDDCLQAVRKLMDSKDFIGPVNIGSEEMVTINQLAEIVMKIANKKLKINHVSGPLGVRGRNSDNKLIKEKLNWEPLFSLKKGMEKTYLWIKKEYSKSL